MDSGLCLPQFDKYYESNCCSSLDMKVKEFFNLDQTHFLSMDTVWGTRNMYTSSGQLAGLGCAVCNSSQYCKQIHLTPAVTICIQNYILVNENPLHC